MSQQPSETRPSTAVVRAVAAREGVTPTELDRSLYNAVNPDALDTLFNESDGSVTFRFHGYIVTLDSEGDVELTEID